METALDAKDIDALYRDVMSQLTPEKIQSSEEPWDAIVLACWLQQLTIDFATRPSSEIHGGVDERIRWLRSIVGLLVDSKFPAKAYQPAYSRFVSLLKAVTTRFKEIEERLVVAHGMASPSPAITVSSTKVRNVFRELSLILKGVVADLQ